MINQLLHRYVHTSDYKDTGWSNKQKITTYTCSDIKETDYPGRGIIGKGATRKQQDNCRSHSKKSRLRYRNWTFEPTVGFTQLRLKTLIILRPSTTSQPSPQIINLNIFNYALASCEQNALFEIILGCVVDLISN